MRKGMKFKVSLIVERIKVKNLEHEVNKFNNGKVSSKCPKQQFNQVQDKCPGPTYESILKRNLRKHIGSVQEGRIRFSCGYCEFWCWSKDNFKQHLEDHRTARTVNTNDFESQSNSTSPVKPYNLVTNQKLDNRGDNELFESKTSYACEKRGFMSKVKPTMTGHNQHYQQLVRHDCGYCPYRTWSQKNLRKHIENTHSGGVSRYHGYDSDLKLTPCSTLEGSVNRFINHSRLIC